MKSGKRAVRTWAAAAAAFTGLFATQAAAICPHTEIREVDQICLDGEGCPPGQYAYKVSMRNNFPHKLYLTFAFSRPDGARITGGMSINADSELSKPIGIGFAGLPEGEDPVKRLGRMRVLECGTDEKIQYKWRLRG